jgi:SAM-dependent methyltransferase
MTEYVLPHSLMGERQRLALMSSLLDPVHRSHIETLGIQPGWRCLEVACGNGSISEWLAGRVSPGGHVVATDLDLRYIANLQVPNLEVRQLNILEDPIEAGAYDLITARAILHHLHDPSLAVERIVSALKPGGVFLSIEPDMLPATVAEPQLTRGFWQGWLKWSASAGIDYSIGRKMPALLAGKGLEAVGAQGYREFFNGGSPWAVYWIDTIRELQQRLLQSGNITPPMLAEFNTMYADPRYWTSVITFIASWGRKPARASGDDQ